MLLKKYTFLLIILLGIQNYGQFKVSGIITNEENKKGLEQVFVSFPDLGLHTQTNKNGYYEFLNLKSGHFLIEVSFAGFHTLTKEIDINSDLIINFELEKGVIEMSQLFLTGVARSTEIKRNPIIITVVGNDYFNQSSSTNIIDALRTVPGVSSINTGPAISKPVIRGLSFNRIITLNNGVRQEGQQWGAEHGIEIDGYSVNRVEIIKGPGSLMYGSDGIGGVLNFLPPKVPQNGQINTEFLSEYQSNNKLMGYTIFNSGRKNDFNWSARFSSKMAANFQNKYDGKVLNSGFEENNGMLNLGLNKKWGHTYLNISLFNSKLGITEGNRDAFGNFVFENSAGELVSATPDDLDGYHIRIPYQKINHLSITSNSFLVFKKGTANVDFGFQNNKRREFEEVDKPNKAGLNLSLNTLNYTLKYNFEQRRGWETSIGINGMIQYNQNNGEEFLIPDYDLWDLGGFIYTQKTFNQISLAGGLRFDNRKMDSKDLLEDNNLIFSSFKNNFNGFSSSIGIAYNPAKSTTFKFNISNGFRAPNIAELASNGIHEGTFRYEIGNPNLKPEFNHQIDFSYSLNSEMLKLEISPFLNFIRNFIYLEKLLDENGNEIFPDPDTNYPAFKFTSGNAKLFGGEVFIDFSPFSSNWLHLENSFSYVHGIQAHASGEAKHLPFMPAPHYLGNIRTEFKHPLKHVSKIFLNFGVEYFWEQNRVYGVNNTETPTPGYTLLNARVGFSIKGFGKDDFCNIFLTANNLTDKAFQNHLNRLKYADENPLTGRIGVFDMGRNFGLKLLLNL